MAFDCSCCCELTNFAISSNVVSCFFFMYTASKYTSQLFPENIQGGLRKLTPRFSFPFPSLSRGDPSLGWTDGRAHAPQNSQNYEYSGQVCRYLAMRRRRFVLRSVHSCPQSLRFFGHVVRESHSSTTVDQWLWGRD